MSSLDDEQRAAVEAPEKVIAVLAGPGSGKTRTLSARTKRLLEGSPGSRALLLTFMNKAAAEMKERVLASSQLAVDRVEAGTFHAFGLKLLRSHGGLAGIDREFDVLDREDAEEIATRVGGTSAMLWELGRHRSRLLPVSRGLREFAQAYETAKREDGVVDFDDLVVLAGNVLVEHPEVASVYGGRYPHVLIDEFQDTTSAQFQIVRALSPHAQTISVFADDDQAIMQFAGADAGSVARFVSELAAVTYPLTINYRSRERIVEACNRLLDADPSASKRRMRWHRARGEAVLRTFRDVTEEARWVRDDIAAQLVERAPHEVAVLARAGWRMDEVVEALGAEGIPVTDWRSEVHNSQGRNLLRASLAILRATLPKRQEQRLCELLGADVTNTGSSIEFLRVHRHHAIAACLSEVRELALKGASPSRLVGIIFDSLKVHHADAAASLESLVATIRAFEESDAGFSVEQLLSELALGPSSGKGPGNSGGVKVATLHATKGLEWPRVYLVGLEEGTLPDYRATSAETLSSERRLCFVGIGRARDGVVLSSVEQLNGRSRERSPFLREAGFN